MTHDEIEKYAYSIEAYSPQAAALLRRLRDERDEARNKALDEAAKVAKVQWLYSQRELIGDADREMELCEEIEAAILALKTQEPTT